MIEEIIIPSPGESITEVELTRWLVSDGELVRKDQEIAEVDSDKATLTLTATVTGKIKISVLENERIPVGKIIGSIDTSFEVKDSESPQLSSDTNVLIEKNTVKQKITPLAKEVIAKNHLGSTEISSIGAKDKITKKDVLAILEKENSAKSKYSRPVEVLKMSMLRKKIGERLVAVKNETAMLTTFNEVDLGQIIEIRNKYKDSFFEKHEIKLGYMSFFAIAVIKALKEYKAVNSQIDGDNIIIPEFIDLCFAISTSKGLVAPPVRDAEKLSFVEIEKAVAALALKARQNKLSIDELTGGTFTITNGGVFGSMMSTPILNPPQSGILGMHKIMERPVVVNGEIVIRQMMYLALSYDHRVIDGKDSVGFLVKVKEILENPYEFIFEGKSPEEILLANKNT